MAKVPSLVFFLILQLCASLKSCDFARPHSKILIINDVLHVKLRESGNEASIIHDLGLSLHICLHLELLIQLNLPGSATCINLRKSKGLNTEPVIVARPYPQQQAANVAEARAVQLPDYQENIYQRIVHLNTCITQGSVACKACLHSIL